MKSFVLLLLFPLMCLFPQKASATLDNFDSYATGYLAGNGYWTQPFVGYESLHVVDNLSDSGSNSVYVYGNPTKTVSATYDDGNTDPNRNVISFYFNVTTLSGYVPLVFDASYQTVYGASMLYFGLFKTSSTTYDFRIDSISPYLYYSYSVIASGLQKNTWHKADVEFNFITKTRRARIDNGIWSPSVNLRYGGLYIKKVQIWAPLTTTFSETYIDDFRLSSLNPPQLSITLNPPEGGNVTGDGIECGVEFSEYCEYEFDSGDLVDLTANPNCGWTFDHWDDGTLCYADNPWTVVMDGSKEVDAVFSPIVSTISVVPDTAQGSVSSNEEIPFIHCDDSENSICSYGYSWDTSVTLKANPKPGYAFSHWEESGITVSTEREYCFLVEGSRELVPVFEESPLEWPLAGLQSSRTIILGFGEDWLEFCDGEIMKHTGIDIAAIEEEVVYASESGVVKVAQIDEDWGGWVTLEHYNSYTTTYWHIIPSVSPNTAVNKGDPIGSIVNYGGPIHLHFGLRNNVYTNPISDRGRLPQSVCNGEPAFQEKFINPETLNFAE